MKSSSQPPNRNISYFEIFPLSEILRFRGRLNFAPPTLSRNRDGIDSDEI